MHRPLRSVAVLLLVFLATPLRALGVPAFENWSAAPRAFVILRSDAPGSMNEFARVLEAQGGHLSVAMSSRTAIVLADALLLDRPALAEWVQHTASAELSSGEVSALSAADASWARVWNEFLKMRSAPSIDLDEVVHAHGHATPDAGPRPVHVEPDPAWFLRDLPDHIPYGAQYLDTSAYLAGSSAVGVWLLEAAGSVYDWFQVEEDQTLAGVVAGLDNWVSFGGAIASASFFLDVHTDVPVSGVPILNPQSTEATWIGEALTNAGWPGVDAYARCFAYNNAIRNSLQTNWCYSIFIVDSDPTVNQGLFSTGGYAWAYYGGPWIYMSRYSTWAFNAANYFEAVPMHETGHIYYATDEYDGIQQANGYLNRNDNIGGLINCIMNQNTDTAVCIPTRNQIAWRDNDADGIMEPLDIAPTCVLDPALPDPTSDPTPTWTGRAHVSTIPNLNPSGPYFPQHAITISKITAVECRADAGAWSAATPVDGTFDAYGEDYTWTSSPLTSGVHVIEARAQDTEGLWTTAFGSDTITITGTVDSPEVAAGERELSLRAGGRNPGAGESRVHYSIPVAGLVRLDVFAIDGSRVRTLFEDVRGAGRGEASWDGRDDLGVAVAAGVYLYRLENAGRHVTVKTTLVR